ncbi:MAG: nitroreductase/quinone reductase family protein [Acidimicrobiales bacterium]
MAADLRPREVATGVHCVRVGRGVISSNVYIVQSGSGWALIDTAWPGHAQRIASATDSLLPGTRPVAILLTHIHPDHSGSALELSRMWGLPVHVHPAELPLAPGAYLPEYANPLDRWLIAPLLSLVPKRALESAVAKTSLEDVARAFEPSSGVPGLPDWECIPTPGHTPGHAAFFRPGDGVLIAGDAVLTVNLNSLSDLARNTHRVSGPPYISTWNWPMAKESVAALAGLEPRVLATGHGAPMTGTATAAALRAYCESLGAPAEHGWPTGLLKPVDYASRTSYRRPPDMYLRLQWLGPFLTSLGVSPKDVVTLEVPGRRSGVIRRTTLVRAAFDGDCYLVALAGESEWVRNVRATGGRVVIGRTQRHAATLVEMPVPQRAPIIRAYLLRWGRQVGSKAMTREARYYFGVSAEASLEEIGTVAEHYPVFRIKREFPTSSSVTSANAN